MGVNHFQNSVDVIYGSPLTVQISRERHAGNHPGSGRKVVHALLSTTCVSGPTRPLPVTVAVLADPTWQPTDEEILTFVIFADFTQSRKRSVRKVVCAGGTA